MILDRGNLIADISVAEDLDSLVVVPRNVADLGRVRGLLEHAGPRMKLLRHARGVAVDGWQSVQLRSIPPEAGLSWRPDAKRFVEIRQHIAANQDSFRKQVAEIKKQGATYAKTLVPDLSGLDTLDSHQIVNVAAMTAPDGFGLCVFDEQGAGKTVTFIFAFDLLVQRDLADVALVVAPKSMVPEWPRDLTRFKADLYISGLLTGSRRDKLRVLASSPDFVVTNFETTVSMEAELRAFLRTYGDRAVLAVDESFFIKNRDAQRTAALRRLREWCGRAYVLCGTPAPNSPHDLVQQFTFVDLGLTFAGVTIPDDRSEARPVVQAAIEERGLFVRHLKSDVLPELPGKTFHRVLMPLAPVQAKLYRSVLADLVQELKRTDDLSFLKHVGTFLAKRSALLQICSNPTSFVDGYSETPCKLTALDGLLRKLIGAQNEKIVIWSFYTASLEAILLRYAQFNPVRYDGKITNVAERRQAVERFQNDDTTMLFVANPAAAGAGLTLHRARYAVYESVSNQAAHYLQSLDRIHRRGQRRTVEYFVLLADKTLEIAEFSRLTDKERAAQLLLGDVVQPPITRESMLREALTAEELFDGFHTEEVSESE